LIGTLLMPFIAVLISLVPLIIFSIKSGPTRIAVADQTGNVLGRLQKNLSAERMMEKAKAASSEQFKNIPASQQDKMRNNAAQFIQDFVIEPVATAGKSESELRSEMLEQINRGELDAYLIIPSDIEDPNAKYEFRSRKGSDFYFQRYFHRCFERCRPFTTTLECPH
jgi:hypothetical protein